MLNVRTGDFLSFVQEYQIFSFFLKKSIAINDNNKGVRNFDKCNN